MSQKIVVFSTNGGGKTIETDATNLKELQVDLKKNNISFEGMKIVDNAKRTLENPEAGIDGVTNIFLMPVKTKSGAKDPSEFTYSEVKQFIKDAIATNEEGAKAHFNVGKNYTNKSTDELKTLIASYKPAKGSSKATATAKPATKMVKTEKVTPQPAAKATKTAVAIPATKEVAKPQTKEVATVNSGDSVEDIAMALEGLKTRKGFDGDLINEAIKAVLRIKVGKEEGLNESELKAQYNEIAKGIPGIKL